MGLDHRLVYPALVNRCLALKCLGCCGLAALLTIFLGLVRRDESLVLRQLALLAPVVVVEDVPLDSVRERSRVINVFVLHHGHGFLLLNRVPRGEVAQFGRAKALGLLLAAR